MEAIISDIINSSIRELSEKYNNGIETVVRTFATPPIKGKITKGKLKWRGIRLISGPIESLQQISWVEQRGIQIGPKFIIEGEIKYEGRK